MPVMTSRRRNLFVLAFVFALLAVSVYIIMNNKTRLGLDLKGGVELVYQGQPTPQAKVTPEAIDRSIEIIRKRVDVLGVAEPEIARSGSDQITVSLPDVKNAERATSQVGKTAQLYFYDWQRNVIGNADRPIIGLYEAVKKASKRKREKYGNTSTQYYLFNKKSKKRIAGPDGSKKELLAEYDDKQPSNSEILTVQRGTQVIREEKPDQSDKAPDRWYIIKDLPELGGTDIKNPQQGFDQGASGQPNVSFEFTGKGRKKFHRVTRRIALRGQQNQLPGQNPVEAAEHFAIILDREIVSRPFIDFAQNPDGIDGRTGAQIQGGFTIQTAQDLAEFLRIGALPINLKLISERQVSATLGKQALDQGLLAGLIGLLLVMLYLIAFYRVLGVVAAIALLFYATFLFAAVKLIPITLTLPGIAGLVLGIGIAADTNIVIFERIKEEIRQGRSILAGISAGYKKGLMTVIDGNMVTFITAFILFVLATSGVKGFAFILGVGIMMSMFTAVVATQAMLGVLSSSRLLNNKALLGAGKQRVHWRFNFVGAAKWVFMLSGLVLVIGAMAFATKGINAGLDFKGGTRAIASLKKSATENQVRSSLEKLGLGDLKIQKVRDPKLGKTVFQISSQEIATEDVSKVRNALNDKFGVVTNGFSSESVGPTFGKQVRTSAIYALIFSLIAVVAYLTWRFQFKFAVPALIALVHDLLIAFGVYSLSGRSVTTATVAALLTIMGYSLYDTVIVFDRVRENIPRMPGAAFSQIINRSMSEVLTRSLNTTFSTLVPVTVLFLFGGDTLKDFAFALIVGIASGTYSSIFIASPVLGMMKEREPLYVRRRLQIAAQFGGTVPAFATEGSGAGFTAIDLPEESVVEEIVSDTKDVDLPGTAGTLPEDIPDEVPPEPLEAGPATIDTSDVEGSSPAESKKRKKRRDKRIRKRKKHGRQ